jgi:hypothetical protein
VFHTVFPLFLFGMLTIFLSIVFKSSNAAAILSVVLAILASFVLSPFPRIYPFLNPFNAPREMSPDTWFQICVQNRFFIAAFGVALFVTSMHLLSKRERLL